MRHLLPTVLLASFLGGGVALPMAGHAQTPPAHDHTHGANQAILTDGEVKRVDPAAGKVTLKHGDIPHLDMPSMTMVFTVRDTRLLTNVKVGDRIRFMAVSEGGKIFLTELQPAP